MTDGGSISGKSVTIKVDCGSEPIDWGQVRRYVSEALRTAAARNARWKAMTPEERAEAEKQAIARMPEAYREWYLKTFGKGQ